MHDGSCTVDPDNQLYTAAQVQVLEHRARLACSLADEDLMRRAGEAAWEILCREWPGVRRIIACCGRGNNGGDGCILAERAARSGCQIQLIALPGRRFGESRQAYGALLRQLPVLLSWPDEETQALFDLPASRSGHTVIVDALFGTGLSRDLDGPVLELVEHINGSDLPVLSLDIPSGLDPDCGVPLGAAVRAQATVSFVGRKRGLHSGQGPEYAGKRYFADLAVPAPLHEDLPGTAPVQRIGLRDHAGLLAPRPKSAHKRDFGHVLVVGGGPGYPGAALLAGLASLRTGAGLVSAATWPAHVPGLVAACPELMVRGVDNAEELQPLLEAASVVVAGPGLGQSDWAVRLLAAVSDCERPLLLDADALNLLARAPKGRAPKGKRRQRRRRENRVLTPHPGEAGRLLSCSAAEVQEDRFAAVRQLQKDYGGVVVLKGSGTLICSPGPKGGGETAETSASDNVRLALSDSGNPGMASAGMGDVLSGVIAALIAQGLPLVVAAEYGVCLHGEAGDQQAAAGGERGLLARDVIEALRGLVNRGP